MQITNETPSACFVFESLDAQDRSIEVIVCRGTFDIANDRLSISQVQTPVVLADVYRDQPLTSSVLVDTDLVPRKKAADITLSAVAHSPDSKPLDSWPVSVRVGKISKNLKVTGPRLWQYGLLTGWQLSKPEPASRVPLIYELAFGGRFVARDPEVVFEQNPVGCGLASGRKSDTSLSIPAHQIEDPNNPITEFGKTYSPAGVGPIAKHWLPRRSLCGTADENWKQTRWPLRPADFDFRYYNSASPGLIYPGFLNGDEEVLLAGVSPDGPIAFSLPGISLTLFALTHDGEITLESMQLDTLHIDTIAMQVSLTWRLSVLKTSGLQTVQIVPEPIHQPSPAAFQEFY